MTYYESINLGRILDYKEGETYTKIICAKSKIEDAMDCFKNDLILNIKELMSEMKSLTVASYDIQLDYLQKHKEEIKALKAKYSVFHVIRHAQEKEQLETSYQDFERICLRMLLTNIKYVSKYCLDIIDYDSVNELLETFLLKKYDPSKYIINNDKHGYFLKVKNLTEYLEELMDEFKIMKDEATAVQEISDKVINGEVLIVEEKLYYRYFSLGKD